MSVPQLQELLLKLSLDAAKLGFGVSPLLRALALDIHHPVSYTHLDVYKRQVTHDLGPALRSARSVLHIGQRGTFLGLSLIHI